MCSLCTYQQIHHYLQVAENGSETRNLNEKSKEKSKEKNKEKILPVARGITETSTGRLPPQSLVNRLEISRRCTSPNGQHDGHRRGKS